ncbi:MAG: DNA polymerase III subunit beta [Chloroflexi bacterium]|nr:DNA polymerase III subunit beta [Chloroflexota bacterium]
MNKTEQLNIEGKRSGEGFVCHKANLIEALTRSQASVLEILEGVRFGRKGFLSYIKSLGGSNVVKVAPSNGNASESQTAHKGIRLVCGANTSFIPDDAWLTGNNRFDGHCQIRISRHNVVVPNLGGLELVEALLRVIPFAEKPNGTKPILRCVKFAQKDGKLSLITCDGYRLAIAALDLEDSDNDILVDAAELHGITSALKKAKRVRLSYKEGGEKDEKFLIIDTEAISYRFKAQVGEYPDYEGVMPSEFVAHANIDSREIMKACQSLSALWLDRECPLKLMLSDGKVTIRAKEDRGEAVIQADVSGQAEIALNASFLMQALKATGGMVELSIKDAATPVLFSAEDFKVLVTPIVWTERKPEPARDEAGKQAVKVHRGAESIASTAQVDAEVTIDKAKDVVAEAEAVVDKAVKKAKSAKTESKDGSKPSVKQREAVSAKAKGR